MKKIATIVILACMAAAQAGKIEPSLKFATDGNYLPLAQARLPVESCGCTNVTVKILRAYENNITYMGMDSWRSWRGTRIMKQIAEKTVQPPGPYDKSVPWMIDLAQIVGTPLEPGAYCVRAYNVQGDWAEDSVDFLLTDIGIAAVFDSSSRVLHVAAHSLKDGSPIEGASVMAVTCAHQVAAEALTDANGVVKLVFDSPDYDTNIDEASHVIVRKDGDLALLDLESSLRNADHIYYVSTAEYARMRCYMYSARDIVRPGERFEVQALVRNSVNSGYRALANAPVDFNLIDRNGTDCATRRVQTDSDGHAGVAFDIPANAPTGGWTVRLVAGGNELSRYNFKVAAYTPDRVKVEVSAPTFSKIGLDEPVTFDWSAKYYFGPDAKDGTWTAFSDACFSKDKPAHWAGWTCGEKTKESSEKINRIMQIFPDGGKLAEPLRTLTIPVKELEGEVKTPFVVQTYLMVSPEGERTVSASARTIVFPTSKFIGVRNAKRDEAKSGMCGFDLAFLPVLKGEEIFADGEDRELEISVSEYRWRRHFVKDDTGKMRGEWVCDEEVRPELAKTIHIPAGTALNDWRGLVEWSDEELPCARLAVEVKYGDTLATKYEFWHNKGDAGERSSSPLKLVLEPDREDYLPGETATLTFRSPCDGVAHIAEGWNTLAATRTIEVKRGENSFAVTVPEKAIAGKYYYVAATVIAKGNTRTRRLFGEASLAINHKNAHLLKVEVKTQELATPGEATKAKIHVTDAAGHGTKARVQVMATDEGVLALTGFRAPNPYSKLFDFAVNPPFDEYDIYSQIYPDLKILETGEFGGDILVKQYPMATRQRDDGTFKGKHTATYMLQPVETDAEGYAEVTLPGVDTTCLLRVMAVAYNEMQTGGGNSGLVVREKLAARISAPRFATGGDVCEIVAQAFNNDLPETDFEYKIASAILSTNVCGTLAKNAQTNIAFTVALPEDFYGEWKIGGFLAGGGETSADTAKIVVRQAHPAQTEVIYSMEPDDAAIPSLENDWIAATEKVEKFDSPAATLKGALDWLKEYPYGCLEQTCAQAFPLLAADDLRTLGLIDEATYTSVVDKVQFAYSGIQAMAHRNGSFGMWPWSDETWTEGSLFARHFIAEAVAKGYLEKDEATSQTRWLKANQLKVFEFPHCGRTDVNAAYSAYILAVMGDEAFLDAARNLLSEDVKDPAARFIAAAALVRGGYKSEGKDELLKGLRKRFWGEGFPLASSRARELGMVLFLAVEAGVDAEELVPLMGELNSLLRNDSSAWGTTAANAWAAAGLAMAAARMPACTEGRKLVKTTRIGIKRTPPPPR
ncbi:MAG: hypothetical protein IJ802_02670, partial [Kiritimatiellae bacterium]|nr:hypothetical protein [Kiritimatiellia bacterium]